MSSPIVAEWNWAVVIVPGAIAAAPLEPTAIGKSRNNESRAAMRAAFGTDESIGDPPPRL
jgi:hypothetical protein